MKRIFSILVVGLLFFTTVFAQPQSLQATLKPGSTANSLYVALKPSLALSGAFSQEVYTFQIPVANPTPSISIKSNPLRGYTDSVPTILTSAVEPAAPGYKTIVLIISSAGKPNYPFVVGTEFNAKEFLFGNGTSPSQMAQIRLADFPGGGATGQGNLYLEVSGNEVEKSSALFYGSGATNNNGGYSYLPQFVVLPIKFTSFSVARRDNDALLNWTVQNQDPNTVSYGIERSMNGSDFSYIGTLDANAASFMNYTFNDVNVASIRSAGVIYYRIKEVDRDGHFVYSEVRSIKLDSKAITINLYPNPAQDYTNLMLDLNEPNTVAVTVTDVAGQTMQQFTFPGVKGNNQHKIDLNKFASGTYMIKVIAGDQAQTIPVVKTN